MLWRGSIGQDTNLDDSGTATYFIPADNESILNFRNAWIGVRNRKRQVFPSEILEDHRRTVAVDQTPPRFVTLSERQQLFERPRVAKTPLQEFWAKREDLRGW